MEPPFFLVSQFCSQFSGKGCIFAVIFSAAVTALIGAVDPFAVFFKEEKFHGADVFVIRNAHLPDQMLIIIFHSKQCEFILYFAIAEIMGILPLSVLKFVGFKFKRSIVFG